MSRKPITLEEMPLEIVNHILSFMSFLEVQQVVKVAPILWKAANLNLINLQKPIFNVLIYNSRFNENEITVCCKLQNKERKTFELRLQFLDADTIGIYPIISIASSSVILPFARKFLGIELPEDSLDAFEPNGIRMAEIPLQRFKLFAAHFLRRIRIDTFESFQFVEMLRDCFQMSNFKAKSLIYEPSIGENYSLLTQLDCVEDVDHCTQTEITEEILHKMSCLKKSRWVSVYVGTWFTDQALCSLGTIQQLHFRGSHTVTSEGILNFILSWLRQPMEKLSKLTEVEDEPHHKQLGSFLNGIWVGEIAFDTNYEEAKRLIHETNSPNIHVSSERRPNVGYPLGGNHTVVSTDQAFICVFYSVPHFQSGIRLVLFVKK